MNEIKIIKEQEVLGKQFRIYGTYENPLFLAKDVAEWIEYDLTSISKMINSVDEAEKVRKNVPTLGGNQDMWFLTEDGVYEVLMQSRKPVAKQFKKQIKEILKAIRKTGGYVANEDLFIDTYLPFADDTTKTLFKSTLYVVKNQNSIIEKQRKEIEYKEDVIIGLVDKITLAEKRQILNRVVRRCKNYQDRWNELYRQFEMKFHINLDKRLESYNLINKPKLKNKLDYIDKVMNRIPDLYDISCKLYENDVRDLVKELYALQAV